MSNIIKLNSTDSRWKEINESNEWTESGAEFQIIGAAAWKE